jgi:cell division protein FtsB
MVKYILLISFFFTTNLFADYSKYQEVQQNQKVKSFYIRAREIAITLENKLNQKLEENKQLKEDIKKLKEKNLKLQRQLERYKKNRDVNSSEDGEADE